MSWNDLLLDLIALVEPDVEKKSTEAGLALLQLLVDIVAALARRPRPRIFRTAPSLVELVKKTLKHHPDEERRLYACHKLLGLVVEMGDESLGALLTASLVQRAPRFLSSTVSHAYQGLGSLTHPCCQATILPSLGQQARFSLDRCLSLLHSELCFLPHSL